MAAAAALYPAKPRLHAVAPRSCAPGAFVERILKRLEQAELREENPHLKSDYRIAFLTVRWSFSGVPEWCCYSNIPTVAATGQVLHCHPDEVWPKILETRRNKLADEYPDWFDADGNLIPQRLDVHIADYDPFCGPLAPVRLGRL